MNKKLLICALLSTGIVSSHQVFAEEPVAVPSPGAQPMPQMPPDGMMMSEEQLKQKQEHLLKMHDLSNKILQAKDPKEKQRMMDEQLQLMKEHQLKHHQMMQKHMQEMMKNKPSMPAISKPVLPETSSPATK